MVVETKLSDTENYVDIYIFIHGSDNSQWRIYIVKFWMRIPLSRSIFLDFYAFFRKIWPNKRLSPLWGWRNPLGNPESGPGTSVCTTQKILVGNFPWCWKDYLHHRMWKKIRCLLFLRFLKKTANLTNLVSPIVLWHHRKPDTDTETEKDPQLSRSHGWNQQNRNNGKVVIDGNCLRNMK